MKRNDKVRIKKYCPICDCEHEIIINEKEGIATIKGEEIKYMKKVYFCPNADEAECEFSDSKIMDSNLLAAKDAYRVKNGLLTSCDIKDIRSKYGLTQSEFALLLDCGEITITRYETKQIQDKCHDEQMRLFRDNPRYAFECLKSHKELFDYKKYSELKDCFLSIVETEGKEASSRELLRTIYSKYDSPSLDNGNKTLDIDILEAIISYFASKIKYLYKIRLMKLLWYTDMIFYNNYGVSMTGLVYTHKQYGALPIGHHEIIGLYNVYTEEEYDQSSENFLTRIYDNKNLNYKFTDEELKVLELVKDKFIQYSGAEIAEYMHKEKAYIHTNFGDIISYEWAKDLNN